MRTFDSGNERLTRQFESINWMKDSGVGEDALALLCEKIMEYDGIMPRSILKAQTFRMILEKAWIAVDPDDIFQDKILGSGIIVRQRNYWLDEVNSRYFLEEYENVNKNEKIYGAFSAFSDFGHTSPNSVLLLNLGFTGLLGRIREKEKESGLSEEQRYFYESCEICLSAILTFIKRMAVAIEPYNRENYMVLLHISEDKPRNIYEAMQLIIIYFFLHEFIFGTRVRTLGRLDVMLYPFYVHDLENGIFTKEEIKEMIKFFFNKFWSAKIDYDLPVCLGGLDEENREVINELSYLLIETYNELNIHSPKIHIRVSDKTPVDFIKLVLSCIRGGNSSFVFINDNTVIKSLKSVGIKETDAMNYVPIGCYEPAVWGKEIGCTGNGGLNLAKAVEYAVTGGIDLNSGIQASVKTGPIETFEDFLTAVKQHIQFMTSNALKYIVDIEKHYNEISSDPILSSMYEKSVERGVDVFSGGAEYNNSSYNFFFIATLVDSVMAVKRLVFDEKLVTYNQLCEILKSNWEGNEKLRLYAKKIPEKYGNNLPEVDLIMKDLTDFCASLVNGKPNGRGGVFKASLFSIDFFVPYGTKTMATPDGRLAGEPLSKNLCATIGVDRNGVTSLVNSVTKIDHSKFPNGLVLDVVLHPSAVAGEDGLDAFYSLLKTYLNKGGMAIHGNVFSSEDLIKAQKDPEKYKTLQVRVCGWNAYFVNLSKTEQDCFIRQSESAS